MTLIRIYFCTNNSVLFAQAQASLLQDGIEIIQLTHFNAFLASFKQKTKAVYFIDEDLSFLSLCVKTLTQYKSLIYVVWLLKGNDFPEGFQKEDTFIVLPLRKKDLMLRITQLLQQNFSKERQKWHLDKGAYQWFRYPDECLVHQQKILLTKKEFDLAYWLFEHEGVPFSRYTLEEKFWNDKEVTSRIIDTHISRIKSKLQLDGSWGYQLELLYGYGYRLINNASI